MPYLTIITSPKPFTNPHINIIQRNAIRSWTALGENVEVLLAGNEAGMAEAASDLGVRFLPNVGLNKQGTPLISSMYALARETGSQFVAIANADILFLPDVLEAVRRLAALADRFLMMGQRWDLDVSQPLDFSPGWFERLQADVQLRGKLHPPRGSDYFIFPRQCFMDVPDFAIGRSGWDNWMIYHAMHQGMLTVDVTPSVKVIHQNHDYSHLAGGLPPYHMEESEENRRMAGGRSHMYILLDVQKQLVDGQVRPAPLTRARLIRWLETRLYPKEGNLRGVRRILNRRLKRLRRGIS
jgi:hypothetical protein